MSYVAGLFKQCNQVGHFQWKNERGALMVKFFPQDRTAVSEQLMETAGELSSLVCTDLGRFRDAAANLKKADVGPETPPCGHGRPYLDEDRALGQVQVRGMDAERFDGTSNMQFSGTMNFVNDPKASLMEKAFAVDGVQELQYTVQSSPFNGDLTETRELLAHSPDELVIGCGAANSHSSAIGGSLGEAYTYRIGPNGQITIEDTQA